VDGPAVILATRGLCEPKTPPVTSSEQQPIGQTRLPASLGGLLTPLTEMLPSPTVSRTLVGVLVAARLAGVCWPSFHSAHARLQSRRHSNEHAG
jgi:hypothetical protein